MPIPRRFDRRPPERDPTRINERIRVPEVRLIGEDGNQIGVVSRDEALTLRPAARPRPGRGRRRGAAAGLPRARLLEVQVRAGAEGQVRAPAPEQGDGARDQAAPEDRAERLRDQEGPRRALPQAPRQGQGHDHVPRSRDDASRSAASACCCAWPRRSRSSARSSSARRRTAAT